MNFWTYSNNYNDYLVKQILEKVHKGYMPGYNYYEYLQRDSAEAVHNSYFSIDKKGNQ